MIKPHKKITRLAFFITGIIATIAYRIIIFFDNPLLVKVFWYTGTVGFILYFGHRYDIARKRKNLIKKYNLVKIVDNSGITEEEKKALHYLVQTTLTSKSRWNSAIIFILTSLALVAAIIIDLFV